MNKDNAHEYLPLVQAMVDGKQLQHKNEHGEWVNVDTIVCVSSEKLRIKPEPRTFDLMIRELDGSICRWNPAHANNQWKRITVQEVLA
jgi:hypothetical protein